MYMNELYNVYRYLLHVESYKPGSAHENHDVGFISMLLTVSACVGAEFTTSPNIICVAGLASMSGQVTSMYTRYMYNPVLSIN